MTVSEAPALDLIAGFAQAAEDAQQAEDAYRKEAATRIAALADERATAFRRLNLVRGAITAISAAEEPEQTIAHARFAIAQALGWDEIGPRQEIVLDRLTPFLEALAAELSSDAAPVEESAITALRGFENWFRAETGSDFYALFERHIPETPRVDF